MTSPPDDAVLNVGYRVEVLVKLVTKPWYELHRHRFQCPQGKDWTLDELDAIIAEREWDDVPILGSRMVRHEHATFTHDPPDPGDWFSLTHYDRETVVRDFSPENVQLIESYIERQA